MTKEEKVLYFLVAKLVGHSVTIVRDGVGGLAGFSVGKGRSLAIADLIALIEEPETQANVNGEAVCLTYTNWRGETSERTIKPIRIYWGSTEWHPEPQWLLTAYDLDKKAERDFALKDFGRTPSPETHLEGLTDEQRGVGIGMAIAAAMLMRIWGNSTYATEILNTAGLETLEKLKISGVEQFDIDALMPILATEGK